MKLGVSRISDEQRQRVITLRRNNSLSKVSELVGLPLGTVKTILSRSGRFKDNPKHRAMFTLPEEQKATSTQPATLDLPPQQVVTGDKEVDALLWLRAVISTGQAGLIERAMEAAKRIETPLKSWRSVTMTICMSVSRETSLLRSGRLALQILIVWLRNPS